MKKFIAILVCSLFVIATFAETYTFTFNQEVTDYTVKPNKTTIQPLKVVYDGKTMKIYNSAGKKTDDLPIGKAVVKTDKIIEFYDTPQGTGTPRAIISLSDANGYRSFYFHDPLGFTTRTVDNNKQSNPTLISEFNRLKNNLKNPSSAKKTSTTSASSSSTKSTPAKISTSTSSSIPAGVMLRYQNGPTGAYAKLSSTTANLTGQGTTLSVRFLLNTNLASGNFIACLYLYDLDTKSYIKSESGRSSFVSTTTNNGTAKPVELNIKISRLPSASAAKPFRFQPVIQVFDRKNNDYLLASVPFTKFIWNGTTLRELK